MKKLFFALTFSLLFFTTCLDRNLPDVNGMWQLKTIEDEQGSHAVDTIFYSFQRQAIFSYTVLYPPERWPMEKEILYGYIDFPASDQLHIQLDPRYHIIKNLTLWKDTAVTYTIKELNTHRLVLSHSGVTYHFINY
ncbi:MAG: lipocalin-like domain-containing protein [Dysgonamonadaceae bacterium]|jgi:hypothetical protein|nr:lipocalin-like domain-containing protein [Dysgonamonadaceae bacterium]